MHGKECQVHPCQLQCINSSAAFENLTNHYLSLKETVRVRYCLKLKLLGILLESDAYISGNANFQENMTAVEYGHIFGHSHKCSIGTHSCYYPGLPSHFILWKVGKLHLTLFRIPLARHPAADQHFGVLGQPCPRHEAYVKSCLNVPWRTVLLPI